MIVFCWRTGVIGLGQRVPRGAIRIASGPARPIRAAVEVMARHAYDGSTLLVPGIPEAESDTAALNAARRFRDQVRRRVTRAVEAKL